jgi:hypothetical protein
VGAVAETVDTAKALLASPSGRRARTALATSVVAAAPFVLRLPAVRAHPIGRIVMLAGGAAALIKLAEAIRDWEPQVAAV